MGEHRLNLSEEVRTKNAIKYHTLKQLKIPAPVYILINKVKDKK